MDNSAVDATSEKLDAMSVACVMEGFEEDDETDIVGAAADDEVLPAPKFNVQIEAINGTIRGEAANIYQERPNWLPSWVKSIAIIRGASSPVFSGKCSQVKLA